MPEMERSVLFVPTEKGSVLKSFALDEGLTRPLIRRGDDVEDIIQVRKMLQIMGLPAEEIERAVIDDDLTAINWYGPNRGALAGYAHATVAGDALCIKGLYLVDSRQGRGERAAQLLECLYNQAQKVNPDISSIQFVIRKTDALLRTHSGMVFIDSLFEESKVVVEIADAPKPAGTNNLQSQFVVYTYSPSTD